jgi:hypothetical protein
MCDESRVSALVEVRDLVCGLLLGMALPMGVVLIQR